MQWFEPIIIVFAVLLVVIPIVSYFVKKKKGTLKCECGHLQSECLGNCDACSKNNGIAKGPNQGQLTYILSIDGMKCGMCESHINDIIRREFHVVKVKSSRRRNTTTVVTRGLINLKKLKDLLQNAGYKVTSIRLK